jgi:hypothetical protein
MRRRYSKGSALLFVLVLWGACTLTTAPILEEEALPPERLELSEGARVAYGGRFDWKGAVLKHGSYYFDNSLGYSFRVDALHLTTSSVQLRPCEEETASSFPFFGISMAYADHVVTDDTSIALVAKVEDAFIEETKQLAVGVVTGGSYCKAFARSLTTSDAEGELGKSTLVVRGAYAITAKTGEDKWEEFDARVDLQEGLLEDLLFDPAPSWQPNDANIDAAIVFTRHPVQAFQGLNPNNLQPVEIAWEILGAMLHSSTVKFHILTPH